MGKTGAFFNGGRERPEKVNKMSQKKSTHNLWTSDKVLVAPGHPELQTRRHQIITNTKGWMIKEPQNRTLIKINSTILVNSGHLYTQLPVGGFSSCVQDTPTYYCDSSLCCQRKEMTKVALRALKVIVEMKVKWRTSLMRWEQPQQPHREHENEVWLVCSPSKHHVC